MFWRDLCAAGGRAANYWCVLYSLLVKGESLSSAFFLWKASRTDDFSWASENRAARSILAARCAGLREQETRVFISTTTSTGRSFVLSHLKFKLQLVVVMSAVEMWKGAMALLVIECNGGGVRVANCGNSGKNS
jgi:hypothetical protein